MTGRRRKSYRIRPNIEVFAGYPCYEDACVMRRRLFVYKRGESDVMEEDYVETSLHPLCELCKHFIKFDFSKIKDPHVKRE